MRRGQNWIRLWVLAALMDCAAGPAGDLAFNLERETEMTSYLTKLFIRLRHDERGVTLVEYGIAIALAVALGTAALTTLGNEIGDAMGAAGAQMPNP